jgi:cytochrome c biogenesis protein CcmG/thiol:disulfide interchange protein DsbE
LRIRVAATGIAIALAAGLLALMGGCGETPMTEETVQVPPTDTAWQGEEAETGPDIEEAEPGQKAPDFTVPLADGGEASLSDYEGKILVLDFWATWCAACVKELPEYQELYEGWDNDKVAYIGMSADGDLGTVRAFLDTRDDLTLPMALADDELLEAYVPTRTLPSSRVIDQDGMLRYEFKGPGAEKVEEAVKRLLAEGEGASDEADGSAEAAG